MSLKSTTHRRTVNGALALAGLLLFVGGIFLGARLFNNIDQPAPLPPATTPTPTPTTPVVQPSVTQSSSCAAGQLRAVGVFEGAAGSREGRFEVTNLSDLTCTLEGTPAITLFDEDLQPITDGVTFSSTPAGWEVDTMAAPEGWPVVTLDAGDVAVVRVRWTNWCPQGRPAPLWRIEAPDGGTVDVNGFDSAGAPPCNGPEQPSTIEVGPFEPRR